MQMLKPLQFSRDNINNPMVRTMLVDGTRTPSPKLWSMTELVHCENLCDPPSLSSTLHDGQPAALEDKINRDIEDI